MDSKQKFKKNRYWKQKYKPRNTTSTSSVTTKQPGSQNAESSNPSDESDSEALKQPVPAGGWFPESDPSSSDSEDFELVLPSSKPQSSPNLKVELQKPSKILTECLPIEVTNKVEVQGSNVIQDQEQLIINEPEITQIKSENCRSKLSDDKVKLTKQDGACSDSDEEELEFLLSLKDPTHTSPIVTENVIGNERRLAIPSNNPVQPGPVKTIDLEKWLDSVLDE